MGWSYINELFAEGRLFLTNKVKYLKKELTEAVQSDKNPMDTDATADHALDALRYGIMTKASGDLEAGTLSWF